MNEQIKSSPSCMKYSYAIMTMMLDCACASMILGHLHLYAGEGKVAVLTILYNLISVCSRGIFAVFADRVQGKHNGVRIGVMIAVTGFILPVRFGLTCKVVLCAVGSAVFHAFCSSSVLSRSSFRAYDIGLYTAGTALGLGIALFGQFWGFITVSFAMMIATASDRASGVAESYETAPQKAVTSPKMKYVFIPLIFLVLIIAGISGANTSMSVIDDKKSILIVYLLMAIGRIVGGILADKFDQTFTLTLSLGAGSVLLVFGSATKLNAFIGIFIINLSIPIIFSLIYRLMPKWAGLSYSLVTGMYYLGMSVSQLMPSISSDGILPISSGLILLVCAPLSLYILISEKHKDNKEEHI